MADAPLTSEKRFRAVIVSSWVQGYRWAIQQRRWWGWKTISHSYTSYDAQKLLNELTKNQVIYPERAPVTGIRA